MDFYKRFLFFIHFKTVFGLERKCSQLTPVDDVHERHLLLEVGSAVEAPSPPHHELVPLLEGAAASHAHEAGHVEHVVKGAHHQVVRRDGHHASGTLHREESAKQNTH